MYKTHNIQHFPSLALTRSGYKNPEVSLRSQPVSQAPLVYMLLIQFTFIVARIEKMSNRLFHFSFVFLNNKLFSRSSKTPGNSINYTKFYARGCFKLESNEVLQHRHVRIFTISRRENNLLYVPYI